MQGKLQPERHRQVLSLVRRMRELCDESVQAAQELISGAAHERRSSRQPELEREFRRLCAESERLDEEAKIEDPVACETDVARHLRAIEQQLREVLAERDEWLRESMRGRRRRGEDRPAFERLKDEQERITAELLRCATWVRSNSESDDEPHMRRVLKMLRLSGS